MGTYILIIYFIIYSIIYKLRLFDLNKRICIGLAGIGFSFGLLITSIFK
jgi:hypothetical protein